MNKSPNQVLLITSSPVRSDDPLKAALGAPGAGITTAETCRDARRIIREGSNFDVIVCDLSLPDGNWSDVMRDVIETSNNACLVIRAPDADQRLWSEALWRGAYDILVEPFSRDEARRTLEGAARATEMLAMARRPAATLS